MRRAILPLLGAAFLLPLTACGAPAGEEQEQEQGAEGEDEEGEDDEG